MEESLFEKYKKEIRKQKNKKKDLIDFIYNKTNITLTEEEFEIDRTKITFYTTSIKKNSLYKKQIKNHLKEIGYELY